MSTMKKQDARPELKQPFRLDGRHALVTGGASGIGEATVKELVRAGAFVWIADINLAAAEALAESLGIGTGSSSGRDQHRVDCGGGEAHGPARHSGEQRGHRPCGFD